MRAAIMRAGRIVVDDVDEPPLEPGQIRVRTLACGICGSDLHALRHADGMVDMSRHAAAPGDPLRPHIMDPSQDVVMGHEFSAEVVERGPGAAHREGDIVVSMPIVMASTGIHPIGYDPAEFAETLRHVAEGTFDAAPMITGSVDLEGVAGAFEALADPDASSSNPPDAQPGWRAMMPRGRPARSSNDSTSANPAAALRSISPGT